MQNGHELIYGVYDYCFSSNVAEPKILEYQKFTSIIWFPIVAYGGIFLQVSLKESI